MGFQSRAHGGIATGMSVTIVPLSRIAPHAIEELLDAAFGHDRHSRTAYRLRNGTRWLADLSFAALGKDGALLGTIQCWPVLLVAGAAEHPLVLVGPVAVAPDQQGAGIGRALMTASMDAVAATGAPPRVMIGDPEYYERFFGFTADATAGWAVPGPVERHRLLAHGADGLPSAGTLCPAPAVVPA